jgi:hypothetical protein
MASCVSNGHDACHTAKLAEQCCRHGQSSQQDRDVQPNIGTCDGVALVASLLAWTIDPTSPSNLDASAVNAVAPPASPPRNCPLLI